MMRKSGLYRIDEIRPVREQQLLAVQLFGEESRKEAAQTRV
jgi:hypothetical protein